MNLMNQHNEFVNPDFSEAPFVEAVAPDVQTRRIQQPSLVVADTATMTTWQKIMSEIAVIQRLEQRPSASDIVRMIEAANTVRELSDQLVLDMEEHRNSLLRALGVEPK